MRKLIHSNFELELSSFKISDTEENSWFSDTFFTKYSFPFEIDLDNDLLITSNFLNLYNTTGQTYFECKYFHQNKIEDAIFEVEQMQQKLSCTLRFGFENLPSFGKKLSELTLEKFKLPTGTTIYNFANTIVPQTWPAVNYNFPQVHIDKIDTTDGIWSQFKKIINNRVDGAFLINEVDDVNEIMYNRNIIQPMPYILYLIKQGIADAGYQLAGEILNDELLKKAVLYADVEYYVTIQDETFYIYKMPADGTVATVISYGIFVVDYGVFNHNYISQTNAILNVATYYATQILTTGGKYRISGTIRLFRNFFINTYFRIKYRNITIEETTLYKQFNFPIEFQNSLSEFEIDVEFETLIDLNPNNITVEVYQVATPNFDNAIIDLEINLVRAHDESGNPLSSIVNKNEIDLKRAVPDILFDDLIKFVKNYLNYDFTKIENGKIYMDPIEDNINFNTDIDLSEFDVEYPLKKYSQGNSFLLKFQDIDSKVYTYLPIFHNKDGFVTKNYKTNEKTTTIEINGLPLPILTRDGIQTAHAFESNSAKIYLVAYDGFSIAKNVSKPINDYLIPAVHLAYWLKWFNFRINSVNYVWRFKTFLEKLVFTSKEKIFAYNQHHIIKTINRTEIAPDEFDVEIETQTLS